MKYVEASFKSRYGVVNTTRGHEWLADEPAEKGGDDEGPRPSELLLSALASCKIITCRMYAEHKGWDVTDIKIRLSIDENEPKIIEKMIRFEGNLDQEQRDRLLVISGRCPVAKMIDPEIQYRLV